MNGNAIEVDYSLRLTKGHKTKRLRRNVYDLYAEILCESMDLLRTSRIGMRAGLNYTNAVKHIKTLEINGLIKPVKKWNVNDFEYLAGYETTEKGIKYIKYYKFIVNLLNEDNQY